MTAGTDPPDRRECGADVAAYALGALDRSDVEAFRRHLETCTICQEELASFQHVVDVLPLSAPQHRAPRAIRRRVLAAVAAEAPRDEALPRRPERVRFAVPRSAMALAAVLLAAVLVVGAIVLGSSGSSPTRVYRASVIGVSGTAQLRVRGGRGQLVVRRLSQPPAGKIYEVWLGRPGHAPQPTTALFGVTARGDGEVDVPGNLKGVSIVMVTPEPIGGSQVPTHSPVISARLA